MEDLQDEFSYMMDQAVARKDLVAIKEIWMRYADFVTYALGEAREYGVAMGAVMEQLRLGLVGVVDLSRRGLTYGDVQSFKELGELRQKYNFKYSSGLEETDYADDPATVDAA